MIIIIPTGWTYTSTINGRVPKGVCCAHCGHEFVYFAHFASVGTSSVGLFGDQQAAQAQASADAQAFIEHAARAASNWVPCPQCGWLQKDMYQGHRRKVAQRSVIAGGVGSLLMIPVLSILLRDVRDVSQWLPPLIMAVPITIGALFAGLWYVLYNPNAFESSRKNRIQEGKRSSFERHEFERQQAEMERAELERNQARGYSTSAAPLIQPRNAGPAQAANLGAHTASEPPPVQPDKRTPEQKRADAKARRDAEMARIAGQARGQGPQT